MQCLPIIATSLMGYYRHGCTVIVIHIVAQCRLVVGIGVDIEATPSAPGGANETIILYRDALQQISSGRRHIEPGIAALQPIQFDERAYRISGDCVDNDRC